MPGGKGPTFDGQLLGLILNGSPIANIADNAASSPLTNLYLSLHTATPTGGNQGTSEAAYTSYARKALARSTGSPSWTISGAVATLAAIQSFVAATGGSETEQFWGIGVSATAHDTGELLYWGPVTPNIVVSSGVTPQLGTGTTITEA